MIAGRFTIILQQFHKSEMACSFQVNPLKICFPPLTLCYSLIRHMECHGSITKTDKQINHKMTTILFAQHQESREYFVQQLTYANKTRVNWIQIRPPYIFWFSRLPPDPLYLKLESLDQVDAFGTTLLQLLRMQLESKIRALCARVEAIHHEKQKLYMINYTFC